MQVTLEKAQSASQAPAAAPVKAAPRTTIGTRDTYVSSQAKPASTRTGILGAFDKVVNGLKGILGFVGHFVTEAIASVTKHDEERHDERKAEDQQVEEQAFISWQKSMEKAAELKAGSR